MKRVIIDTDPGIDDTAALLFAFGSPELEVEALTTIFGNVSLEQCTRNALTILEAAGRAEIPVYQGVARSFGLGDPPYAPYIHGSDGLGDTDLPMPEIEPQTRNRGVRDNRARSRLARRNYFCRARTADQSRACDQRRSAGCRIAERGRRHGRRGYCTRQCHARRDSQSVGRPTGRGRGLSLRCEDSAGWPGTCAGK